MPHNKNTKNNETVIMPVPGRVAISMQQHIGGLCTPTVKINDYVKVGQVVGDSEVKVSAPMHSSVSGTVKEIKNITLSSGKHVPAVIIEPDGLQAMDENIKIPCINSKEDFIREIRKSGLVGLGGAGFPTHVKLDIPSDSKVDTLLINAAECEPYITTDNRECLENPDGIIEGIKIVMEYLNIPRCFIVIEDNKLRAINLLREKVSSHSNIKVYVTETNYPRGAEKVIIYKTLGRKVPAGLFPYNIGVLVLNVQTVSFIASFMKTGIPLIDRRITVDGEAIAKPGNVRIPLGTYVKDIIDYCGGYKETPVKILHGGPMMGFAINSDELPVLKQNNAILAFGKKEAHIPAQQACIRCGRCLKACPMSLEPYEMVRIHKLGLYEELKKMDIASCMECGSCAYSCPAGRSLVQYIRLAKAEIRKRDRLKREVVQNGK